MMNITPKKRMLTAYKGQKPDRVPVAPEFWYYIPAKVLGGRYDSTGKRNPSLAGPAKDIQAL